MRPYNNYVVIFYHFLVRVFLGKSPMWLDFIVNVLRLRPISSKWSGWGFRNADEIDLPAAKRGRWKQEVMSISVLLG